MPESSDSIVSGLVVTAPAETPTEVSTLEGVVLDGLDLNDHVNYGIEEFASPIPRKRLEEITGADANGAILARPALHENGVCTIVVDALGDSRDQTDFLTQLIVNKLQRAEQVHASTGGGLPLIWTPAGRTDSLEFTVQWGEITERPVDHLLMVGNVSRIALTLTCAPGGLGDEVTVGPVTVTGPVGQIEVPNVEGDLPADATLTITDLSGQARRYVEWGAESEHYNPATPIVYDSDQLVTAGYSGTGATQGAAYDPNAASPSVILAIVYGGAETAVCATPALAHVGKFLIKARVYSNQPGTEFRAAYRIGDTAYGFPKEGWVQSQVSSALNEIVLGSVTIPPGAATQTWNVRIDARNLTSSTGSAQAVVDYVTVFPISDGYGKARAVASGSETSLAAAFDSFDQHTAGALTGKTTPLPTGGTWAGAGNATDFTVAVVGSNIVATRSANDALAGRYALAHTGTYSNVLVQSSVQCSETGTFRAGVLCRYVDTSNWLAFVYTGGNPAYQLMKKVAGTETVIQAGMNRSAVFNTVALTAFETGLWQTFLNGALLWEGTDPVLAAGGALASGRIGLYDAGNTTGQRQYDYFSASQLTAPPVVMHPLRSLVVGSSGVRTVSLSGAAAGSPPMYRGAFLRLQPAGDSGRITRIAVRATRDDLDAGGSGGSTTDQLQLSVSYRSRHLLVPWSSVGIESLSLAA